MERIGFGEFGLHAMAHRPGVLGWPEPLPYIAKYAFQYLFVQAEFGLMCPISVTDTGAVLVENYGSDESSRATRPHALAEHGRDFQRRAIHDRTRRRLRPRPCAVMAERDGDHWRF